MQLLNRELQIYSGSVSELTFGFVRSLVNFSDDKLLNDVSVWYDKENDKFVINETYVNELYEFCEKGLQRPLELLKRKLPELQGREEIALLIIQVLEHRKKRSMENSRTESNPNSKFVSIGGDIFQISKIVSVKTKDEAEKSFIEVYITNKRASIKKQFSSRCHRDAEFAKVKSILEMSA